MDFSPVCTVSFCQTDQMQGLICAGTVRYGVPALILEAVRRIHSSSCHNGGTQFICEVQNVTKVQNCNAPVAYLRLKMHQNSFPAEVVPASQWGAYDEVPAEPVVGWGVCCLSRFWEFWVTDSRRSTAFG